MNTVEISEVTSIRLAFSKLLSTKLNTSQISKKQLAEHIGVSANTIRNVLKGENFNFNVAIQIDLAMNLGFFTTSTTGEVATCEDTIVAEAETTDEVSAPKDLSSLIN